MAEFLTTAIESVLSQTMADLELVVGDNVSTDATSEIVRRYERQDSRVRYFRNTDHVSCVENFNLCYQRSDPSSKYIAVLASDDWWNPTFLAKLIEVGETHPSATIIHADMYRTDVTGRVINRYSDLFQNLPPPGTHRAVRELYQGCYICIMAALVNREMKTQVYPTQDLFDSSLKLTPDYYLWLQLLTRGAYAYYIPEPLSYYRKHEGAQTMPKNAVPRMWEEVTIFRDKLRGVCPPDLEQVRHKALSARLVAIGFELLDAGRAKEARSVLHEAHQLNTRRRLDVPVARVILSLPLSEERRSRLWRLAMATARVVGRVQ